MLSLAASVWLFTVWGVRASVRARDQAAAAGYSFLPSFPHVALPGPAPAAPRPIQLGAHGKATHLFRRLMSLVSPTATSGAAFHYAVYPPLEWMGIGTGEGPLWALATCFLGIVAPALGGCRARRNAIAHFGLVGRPWRAAEAAADQAPRLKSRPTRKLMVPLVNGGRRAACRGLVGTDSRTRDDAGGKCNSWEIRIGKSPCLRRAIRIRFTVRRMVVAVTAAALVLACLRWLLYFRMSTLRSSTKRPPRYAMCASSSCTVAARRNASNLEGSPAQRFSPAGKLAFSSHNVGTRVESSEKGRAFLFGPNRLPTCGFVEMHVTNEASATCQADLQLRLD